MSATAVQLQEDALIESFINGDLFLRKMVAPKGSTMENYYMFSCEKGVLHIAMDADEAADIMAWLRDEATIEE